jgi:hypothetical protein
MGQSELQDAAALGPADRLATGKNLNDQNGAAGGD